MLFASVARAFLSRLMNLSLYAELFPSQAKRGAAPQKR